MSIDTHRPDRVLGLAIVVLLAACKGPDGGSGGSGAGGPVHTTRPGAPPACAEVITAPAAQQIFRQLSALHGADGCALHELTTQQSVMRTSWTRADGAPPEVVITPAACAHQATPADGPYVIENSAAFAAACPTTFAAMRRTFASTAPAPTHMQARSAQRPYGRAVLVRRLLVVLTALLLAALGVARWRRGRAGDERVASGA